MKKIVKIERGNINQKCVYGVKLEDKNLELTRLSGHNMTVKEMLYVLKELGISEYSEPFKYDRKHPYKVIMHSGMSDNRHYQIQSLVKINDFYKVRRNTILYITCRGKIQCYENIFLPDLKLILDDLYMCYIAENLDGKNYGNDYFEIYVSEPIEIDDSYTIPNNYGEEI